MSKGITTTRCRMCGEYMRRERGAKTCFPCAADRVNTAYKPYGVRLRAAKELARAINNKSIPALSNGDILCVDCGETATCYDHRDYTRPLEVEPVCKGCNNRRGTAKGFIPIPDKPPRLPVRRHLLHYANGLAGYVSKLKELTGLKIR